MNVLKEILLNKEFSLYNIPEIVKIKEKYNVMSHRIIKNIPYILLSIIKNNEIR